MSLKILVNATYGLDDVERATVPFIVASASAASANQTVMFLTADSVRLATAEGVNGAQADGYPSVAELVEAFVENGGAIWVCPVCAKAQGIETADLLPGAEIAGAARTIGYLAEGARTIM